MLGLSMTYIILSTIEKQKYSCLIHSMDLLDHQNQPISIEDEKCGTFFKFQTPNGCIRFPLV